MDGSNEFVECFCWGAVAEGGSGAVCHTPPRASSALIWRGVRPWDKLPPTPP